MILCVSIFKNHCYEMHYSMGLSMLPTLNPRGEIVLLNKWKYKYGQNIKVGDVVVARKPNDSTKLICKRVIGLPGDIVCKDPTTLPHEYLRVPLGHAWLTGDNLAASLDSRSYGPVPLALLTAKVIARVYPNRKTLDNTLNDVN